MQTHLKSNYFAEDSHKHIEVYHSQIKPLKRLFIPPTCQHFPCILAAPARAFRIEGAYALCEPRTPAAACSK